MTKAPCHSTTRRGQSWSVGFEGRYDDTALGTVVDIASRLCAEAAPGEVLLDDRAHAAVATTVMTGQRSVQIKGLDQPVRLHVVGPDRSALEQVLAARGAPRSQGGRPFVPPTHQGKNIGRSIAGDRVS